VYFLDVLPKRKPAKTLSEQYENVKEPDCSSLLKEENENYVKTAM
jgi:hypothetical protein